MKRRFSEAHKLALRKAKIGCKLSKEHKRKIGVSTKLRLEDPIERLKVVKAGKCKKSPHSKESEDMRSAAVS